MRIFKMLFRQCLRGQNKFQNYLIFYPTLHPINNTDYPPLSQRCYASRGNLLKKAFEPDSRRIYSFHAFF